MAQQATYSAGELSVALASSNSWRAVLGALGLRATSGNAIASVRRHAERLGLPTEHLVRPRNDVLPSAPPGGSGSRDAGRGDSTAASCLVPLDMTFLRRTGPLLSASWYSLRGAAVSWPLEPCAYDLLVGTNDRLLRVQVKTTTARENGVWKVFLSRSGRERRVYGADEVDMFFVIDGELGAYEIPAGAVAGRHAVHLNRYEEWRVHGAPFAA